MYNYLSIEHVRSIIELQSISVERLGIPSMQGRREGGATGAFSPRPHSAYGLQKIDIL